MRKIGLVLVLLSMPLMGAWSQTPDLHDSEAQQSAKDSADHESKLTFLVRDEDGAYEPSKGVSRPKLIHAAAAAYPTDPGLAGVRHGTTLDVVIGADGTPGVIKVAGKPIDSFDQAAISAIRESRFTPGTFLGDPAPVRVFIWVPFLGIDQPAIPEMFPLKNSHPPAVLNSVAAEFSKEARKARFQGIVMISALVSEEGLPTNIRVVLPLGMGLDQNAMKAVSKYRFRPASKDGMAVPVPVNVEVNFRLYRW